MSITFDSDNDWDSIIQIKRKVIDGDRWLKGSIDFSNFCSFKIHHIDDDIIDGLEIPTENPLEISVNSDWVDIEIPANVNFKNRLEEQNSKRNPAKTDSQEDWQDIEDQVEKIKSRNNFLPNSPLNNQIETYIKDNSVGDETSDISKTPDETNDTSKTPNQTSDTNSLFQKSRFSSVNSKTFHSQSSPSDSPIESDFAEDNLDIFADPNIAKQKFQRNLAKAKNLIENLIENQIENFIDFDLEMDLAQENQKIEINIHNSNSSIPQEDWSDVEIPPNLAALEPQKHRAEMTEETKWLFEDNNSISNQKLRQRVRKFQKRFTAKMLNRPTITNYSTLIQCKSNGTMVFDPEAMIWKGNERELQIFHKPFLLRCLNKWTTPRVVGSMKFNPKKQKWEGNENSLSIFKKHSIHSRKPGLIQTKSPTKEIILNNMTYDPKSQTWYGNDDCLRIFEHKKPTLIPLSALSRFLPGNSENSMRFNSQKQKWEKINEDCGDDNTDESDFESAFDGSD
ncbi:mitotic check point protein bfa1 [Anaeramoeba ignava]|uniref:Mitotic check point protein bfa1 n=1 Tax=Anaeramoeba ignava TaxID=1746090 RepID=A0A9Q0RJB9_ANAIG|nr:mitotic check point protein bfa1 [Anaeramoeba ignava]